MDDERKQAEDGSGETDPASDVGDRAEDDLDAQLAVLDRPAADDAPDEELVSLPAPSPRRGRNPIFMAAVILLSLAFLWWVRLEIAYFFASGTPVDLGDAMDLDVETLPSNAYVTMEAWPNPTRVVKYTQRLRSGVFRMFPVVGQKKLFIQTHFVDEEQGDETAGKGLELGSTYTGRLLRYGSLDSSVTRSGYQNVSDFFREKLFIEVDDDCFLLIDGMAPRSMWNSVVFGFALAILVVCSINAILFVRYFWTLLSSKAR